jgi:hypothetical protein
LGDPAPEEIFAGNELIRVFHQEIGHFPRQLRSLSSFISRISACLKQLSGWA